MSSFTPLNDKEDSRNFVSEKHEHGRQSADELPSLNRQAAKSRHDADSITVSQSPIHEQHDTYQDQITEWLRRSKQAKFAPAENTVAESGVHERPPVTALPAMKEEVVTPRNGGSMGRKTPPPTFIAAMGRSFRESFGRVSSDTENRENSNAVLKKTASKGREAWRKVQDIIRFGSVKTENFYGMQDQTKREVTRQRDVVAPKESKEGDAPTASWPRPFLPSSHLAHGKLDESYLERVEAIVSKASSYAGPKTLQSEQEGSLLYWLTMTAPYLKVGGFVILSTVDLVLAIVFHVAWTASDFMCKLEDDSARPESVIMGLLGAVAFLHFLRTATKLVKTDGGGEFIGLRYFYSKELFGYGGLWVNNADFFLNAASVTVLVIHAMDCEYLVDDPDAQTLYHIIVRRIHGHMHLIRSLFAFQRCFSMNEYLRQQLQIAVSVNKRRFISAYSNINLDLTYICDRLIAMAIPCVDYVMYRNDIRDVARFFAAFHYGTFLVYNLCERHEEGGNGNYDTSLLYNQVVHVSFHDHNVPRFRCLVKFCETASAWLNAGDKNVIAVHCQGGKGRTGSFCSALLLWTGYCATAQEALDKFALRRTQRMRYGETLQGVSSPAQIRYVHYLEAYVYEGVDYQVCNYRNMHQITLYNLQHTCIRDKSLTFIVEVDGVTHFDYGKEHGFLNWDDCEKSNFMFQLGDLLVAGDVTVRFFLFDETEAATFASHNRPGTYHSITGEGARTLKYGALVGKQMIFVSFHTAFHRDNMTFMKNEIDGAYHAPDEKYGEDFSITLHLRETEGDQSTEHQSPKPDFLGGQDQLKGLEEFLPQKINPSVQFLKTCGTVVELFEKLCPHPISFHPGENVFERTSPGHIVLHYVVTGSTTSQQPSSLVTTQSIKGVFEGDIHGVGDVLHQGMDKFFVGERQKIFAAKAGLQTRVIEIPLSSDGYLPIESPNLDQHELAALYSFLATQVSSRARKYRDKITSLHNMNATKRTTKLIENSGNKKVLVKLRDMFGIDKTESLFCGSPIRFQEHDGVETAGQAYVVSNWVLCMGNRSLWKPSSRRQMIIRIHDIRFVKPHGASLHVHMTNDREPSLEPSSSSDDIFPSETGSVASNRRARRRSLPGHGRRHPGLVGKTNGHVGLMQKRHMDVDVILKFPDEGACEAFCAAVNERLREMPHEDNRKHSNDMSSLKFGYILPSERDDVGGQAFLQHLLNISEVKVYAPGEEIISHGDSHRSMYHIISGTALRNSGSNNEDVGPGEMFGEWRFLAFNTGFAETNQVVASTEVKCFVSPFEQVQTLCSLRKEFAVRFYRGLALSCIIRARQFRWLYQQNLKRVAGEREDIVRVSRKTVQTTRNSPNRLSFSTSVFQSTANLFSGASHGAPQAPLSQSGSHKNLLNPRNTPPHGGPANVPMMSRIGMGTSSTNLFQQSHGRRSSLIG